MALGDALSGVSVDVDKRTECHPFFWFAVSDYNLKSIVLPPDAIKSQI